MLTYADVCRCYAAAMAAAARTTEAAAAAAAAAVPNASVAIKAAATPAVSAQASATAVLCTLCFRIRVRILLICVPAYACTHMSGCCCISSGLTLLAFFSFFPPPQAAAACEAAATAAACAAANASSWEATSVRLVDARCSVYLLYWYKSTNTDAKGGALLGSFLRLRTRASSRCGRSPCPTPHGFRSKSALAYIAWIRYFILVKLRL